MELNKKQIKELKSKHQAIRDILINNNCEEFGDCIIDEICSVFEILPTTAYYKEE